MKRRHFMGLSAWGLGAAGLSLWGDPKSFIPRPSEQKWAVLFGTWTGTARDAGNWISEGMGGIASVYDVRSDPDLGRFDRLIIGTAIRGGKGPRELEEFIKKHLARIRGKIMGYFAVCGNLEKPVGPEQTKTYINEYLADLCQVAAPGRVFNGRITRVLLDPADYRSVEDLYRQLKMPPLKDYDLLKRVDCLDFGARLQSRKT